MDTNKMREQFEEFMRRKPKRMRSAYLRAFEAGWQASREAVVVELPSEDGMDGHLWAPDVVDAIKAQGLRVAP